MRKRSVLLVLAAAVLLTACGPNRSTAKQHGAGPSRGSQQVSVPLPGWNYPAGLKITRVYSGSMVTDNDVFTFTMNGGPKAFAYRYNCPTGHADNNRRNGQFMGVVATSTPDSGSQLNGLAWRREGAGYSPLYNLVSVDAKATSVTFYVAGGGCTVQIGQINDSDAPADPILQTP